MGAPAKFLFDADFSDTSYRGGNLNHADASRQIAEAEARATKNGYAAGYADASAETAHRATLALEQISNGLGGIAARLGAAEARVAGEAVDVAVAIARKLCGELTRREPLTEMMELISDCLRHLVSTPHLVVRLNDALYDAARPRIEDLARQCGFEGRLVILADSDVAGGDCKIEWADGGIVSDRSAVQNKITELVGRYLASRNTTEAAR